MSSRASRPPSTSTSTSEAPVSVRDVVELDHTSYKAFVARLEDNGVRVHPRGVWYLSTAHNEDDVEHTLEVVRDCVS